MPPISYSQLLRQNRNFRLLWGGQIVSQLGDWFSLITLQSLLLQLTGSASSVAILMAAQMLPLFLLGPVAGVVVDRLPRKRVMIVSDLVRAGVALGFLLVRSRQTAWLAYACFAALSSLTVFFEPARQAMIPVIAADDELVSVNALGAVTWSLLLTSGALVGGVVTQFLGRDVAFVLNSLSFVGSAFFIRAIRVPRPPSRPTHAGGISGAFAELASGFHYVMERRELLALLSVKAAWGMTYGSTVLLTLFGQRIFPLAPGKGPLTISLLTAASGVGTALGPIIGRRLAGSDPRRMLAVIPISYLGSGLFFLTLGRAGTLAGAAAAFCGARMGGSTLWVFSTVLLQQRSADRFRGRVFAADGALSTLTMALSGLAVGTAIDRGASAFSAAFALGILCLIAGAVWSIGLLRQRPGNETESIASANCSDVASIPADGSPSPDQPPATGAGSRRDER